MTWNWKFWKASKDRPTPAEVRDVFGMASYMQHQFEATQREPYDLEQHNTAIAQRMQRMFVEMGYDE
jgi:hypothetical protein